MKNVLVPGVVILWLAGCTPTPTQEQPTTTIDSTTSTTSTTTTASTTEPRPEASTWLQVRLSRVGQAYSDFVESFEEHMVAFEWDEARIDCTLAAVEAEGWADLLFPTPSAELDALVPQMLDAFTEGFAACEEAESLAEWQERTRLHERAITIFNRIVEMTDS